MLPRRGQESGVVWSMMPTRSKAQARLPSFCGKIWPLSGMRSPSFQPKRATRSLPAITPVRVAFQAAAWSSGTLQSLKVRSQRSGSVANCAKKFSGAGLL